MNSSSFSPENSAKRAKREDGDLERSLIDQLSFIDSSARLFDEGSVSEAVRLAIQVRILVHDARHPSLLNLLGIKNSLSFVGTAINREKLTEAQTAFMGQPPVSITPGVAGFLSILPNSDGSFGFYAPLKEHRFHPDSPEAKATPTSLSFDDWWNEPVVETGTLTYFSRRELIDIMANQDGGAHVSEKLNAEYVVFKKDSFGFEGEHGNGNADTADSWLERPFRPIQNDPAAASARQIAFELALTLHRYINTLPDSHLLRALRKPMYECDRPITNEAPYLIPFIIGSASAQPAYEENADIYATARRQLRGTYYFDQPKKPK